MTSSSFVFGSTSEREAVPVNVFEDMLVEGEENFMLSLTAARVGGQSSSGAQLGSQQDTQITIQDNDGKIKMLFLVSFEWYSVLLIEPFQNFGGF